tara:strand:- start:2551 stop:2730 length:180 start_codon:yes stop_codon:yes gene_type:complete
MKNSTKNQIEGKILEQKGKLKEVAGILTDKPELERKGSSEKVAGKIQKKIGEVQQVLED